MNKLLTIWFPGNPKQIHRLKLTLSLLVGLVAGIFIFSFVVHEPRNESIFVYGTLKNPMVRSLACWCYTEAQSAELTGYAAQGLNIVPVENSIVTGKTFKVSPAELARLDRYENVPEQYVRKAVTIDDEEHFVYVLSRWQR